MAMGVHEAKRSVRGGSIGSGWVWVEPEGSSVWLNAIQQLESRTPARAPDARIPPHLLASMLNRMISRMISRMIKKYDSFRFLSLHSLLNVGPPPTNAVLLAAPSVNKSRLWKEVPSPCNRHKLNSRALFVVAKASERCWLFHGITH